MQCEIDIAFMALITQCKCSNDDDDNNNNNDNGDNDDDNIKLILQKVVTSATVRKLAERFRICRCTCISRVPGINQTNGPGVADCTIIACEWHLLV